MSSAKGYGSFMISHLKDKATNQSTSDYLNELSTIVNQPIVPNSTQQTTVNGYSGLVVVNRDKYNDVDSKNVYVTNGTEGIQLSFDGYYSNENRGIHLDGFENLSVFDQILSTFQFSGSNQTTDISNWKMYTNATYAYSIKLPSYFSQLMRGPGNATIPNPADWIFDKTDVSLLDAQHKSLSPNAAIEIEIASYPQNVGQANYNLHCKGDPLSFNQENPTISNTSPISGVEQYVQSYGQASHSTVPQIKYWDSKTCFIENGIDYEIYYQNYENTNTDPVLNHILSTFQLTK
jgi:hypothetical protein